MNKLYNWFFCAITFFTGGPDETARRRVLRYALYCFIVLVGNVLLGKNISNNRYPLYANVSSLLMMNLNIILVLVLFTVLFRNIAKLMVDRREKVFGARLQTKLVIFSVLLVVLPVFFTYMVSTRFVSGSIDRWFDSNVNNTIVSAVAVNKGYQDEVLKNITAHSWALAANIGATKDRTLRGESVLAAIREYTGKYGIGGVALYSGKTMLYTQQSPDADYFSFINEKILSAISGGIPMSAYVDGDNPFFWNGVPINMDGEMAGVLFIIQKASLSVHTNAGVITHMYDLMKQLKFYSHPVRTAFNVSNFLIALLVIFASMWGSIIFVRNITVPLEELSAAATDISKGNLDIQVDASGNDEVTLLSRSFNTMAAALKERTKELHRKNKDLAVALTQIYRDKRNIDIIYANVDSGIVLFDPNLIILKKNEHVESFSKFLDQGDLGLKEFASGPETEKIMQLSFDHEGETRVFSVHMNKIFDTNGLLENIILVVDDNTHILNLQRITLWKEVATRITHEIKNPLTPIKLIAERVKKRSREIADPVLRELVEKSMQTVITEAEDLLTLVDEFNQYARLPSLIRSELNLKKSVKDVVDIQEYSGKKIKISIDMADDLVVKGDKNQLKRAFVNLLQNAIHAIAQEGEITITGGKDHYDAISLIIEDNGCGIKEEDLDNVFVPYFSKKPDGTGLGLAIVKKIIEEHGGSISVESNAGEFTRFHIHLPY